MIKRYGTIVLVLLILFVFFVQCGKKSGDNESSSRGSETEQNDILPDNVKQAAINLNLIKDAGNDQSSYIKDSTVVVNLKILYNWSQSEFGPPPEMQATQLRQWIVIGGGLLLLMLLFLFLWTTLLSMKKTIKGVQEAQKSDSELSKKIDNLKFFVSNKIEKEVNEKLEEVVSKKDLNTRISELQNALTLLTNRVEAIEKKASEAQSVVESATQQDAPLPEVPETLIYYYEPPSSDVFINQINRENPMAGWIIEVADEHAAKGIYYLNPTQRPFSFLMNKIDVFLKPFAEIMNYKEVDNPTKVEYLKKGKVQRTAEGWKIVEKVKFNLF